LLELLSTKLFIPRPRSNLVSRPRLIERLNISQDRKLTLIAAPAGFGKTTLLSEWIPQSPRCVTWLSLDEGDNDPVRFWIYVIASLGQMHPDLGLSALAILQSPKAPLIQSILTVLINDIAKFTDSFSTVLDDYHVIDSQPIHDGLAYLIDHLPDNIHLVITTRIDPPLPLGRLRARDQLTEIRAKDLRFKGDESVTFLNKVMGLKLSVEEVKALDVQTEGWVAGLQIAALSMQGHEDISGFIRAFSGSHRHILGYLADEVINQRPKGTLDFLLQTSILNRLCGPLCEAVTGQRDGEKMLKKLDQANLFIVPLDDEGKWYRYHHLFADILRHHLKLKGGVQALHRRASQWYEQAGLHDEALHHALAAPDHDLAVSLVERNAHALLFRSETVRLQSWLVQLPEELIRKRPQLVMIQCWLLADTGQFDRAKRALAATMFQDSNLPSEISGEMAVLQAFIARCQDDAPAALERAQQALEVLPPQSHDWRASALLEIGLAHHRLGDKEMASETLSEVVAFGESEEHHLEALVALGRLRRDLARQGRFTEAAQMDERGLRMLDRWDGHPLPISGIIFIGLGTVLCEWNILEEASQRLQRGLKLLLGTIEDDNMTHGYIALSRVQQAQGDSAKALASIQSAEDWLVNMHIVKPAMAAMLRAHRARLWLRQGNLESARQWVVDTGIRGKNELSEGREVEYLTLARVLTAWGRHNREKKYLLEAHNLLDHLLAAAETDGRAGTMIEILGLNALVYQAQNNLSAAIAALERALTLAEPEGYIRIFVDEGEQMRQLLLDYQSIIKTQISEGIDREIFRLLTYSDKLLASFSPQASFNNAKYQSIPEPLSDRELDILQLIATGRTNKEIAEILVIAVSTVKSHINNLYGKLGAKRRTEAIAIARDFGLLAK
jgi:LuxR family maltose regulon positive regulatory protein